jgi:hypothetical protein
MTCIEGICENNKDPEITFEWGSKLYFSAHHCKFTAHRIKADEIEKPLFTNRVSSCLANMI